MIRIVPGLLARDRDDRNCFNMITTIKLVGLKIRKNGYYISFFHNKLENRIT